MKYEKKKKSTLSVLFFGHALVKTQKTNAASHRIQFHQTHVIYLFLTGKYGI